MKSLDALNLITPIAAEQAGYFSSQQAHRAGVDDDWVLQELRRRGLIRRVRRGVYMIEPGRAASPIEDALGSWLALAGDELPWEVREPGAVLSHATAAALQGLGTIVPTLPELTVSRQVKKRPDMRTYVAHLAPEDWRWLPLADGLRIAVTTPARTIVDLYRAGEERDYLKRATREAFPDEETAWTELDAAARRRHQRSNDLRKRMRELVNSAWQH